MFLKTMVKMLKPFRIAVVQSIFPNCTFDIPPCWILEKNSELIGLTKLIVSFLNPVGYNKSDIRFVPATGYGPLSKATDYKTSALGMVSEGNAEMSDYVLSLTLDRAQDFPNTGPIDLVPPIFVYQRPNL